MNPSDIIPNMTLKDKVAYGSGQSYWRTKAFSQYAIPSIKLNDGPHGLRQQDDDVNMLGVHDAKPATCFPTSAATACSWDRSLERAIGEAIGREAAVAGVSVILGPGNNIKRNPLCGRNFEYYSEDPVLSGHMAAAFVQGIQSQGIGATVKHFAANNQEYKRFSSNSVMDERTLREIYLKAFEIVVKQAQPKLVMSSYNKLNGIYTSNHSKLLHDILRQEWGFEGMVVTDWGGLYDRIEAYKAGLDLVMPGGSHYMEKEVVQAIEAGQLDEALVDQAVERLLKTVAETDPETKQPITFSYEDHHQLALRAATESAVLLKNSDGLLPIAPDKTVCLIGHMAQAMRFQGSGSSFIKPTRLVQPTAAMADIPYLEATSADGSIDDGQIILAKQMAAAHDIAIVTVGLPPVYESEGFDREHMRLPDGHNELIEEVVKANPNTVVVLFSGSPVETPWLDQVGALLYMVLPGQAGGQALHDLLYGHITPSGKLSETWPLIYEDVPSASFYSHGHKDARYREGIYVGYRYYDKADVAVRFPFGFGLSYTTFEYARLELNGDYVSFDLTNTGDYPGAEIVQLYIAPSQTAIHRPKKELKDFKKVFLKPGETRRIEFGLDESYFSIWHQGSWQIPGGEYKLLIASDVSSVELITEISVPGTIITAPDWQAGSWYETLQGTPEDADWFKLLGYEYQPEKIIPGQFDMSHSIAEMKEHSRLMRLAYWGLKRYIGRTIDQDDEAVYQMMLASSAESSLSSLQVIGQLRGGLIRSALHFANHDLRKGVKALLNR